MIPNQAVAADIVAVPESEVADTGRMAAESIVIDTRFGHLEFDPTQAISMPRGMMGFPESKIFALTGVPDPKAQNFLLPQSLTDHGLSFLALPLSPESVNS